LPTRHAGMRAPRRATQMFVRNAS